MYSRHRSRRSAIICGGSIRHLGHLAQLVEHSTDNRKVASSSLAVATVYVA